MSAKPAINKSMTPLEWGMVITLSILWGGSFFFNGVVVRELPTFTVVVGRVILGAAALLIVMRFMGLRMPKERAIWQAFFGMGFLNNVVPFTLIVWGQAHVASSVASILNATTPLFTVIVAHFLTSDEKMTGSRLLGVAMGFAGVIVMIGGDSLHGLGLDLLAPLACLGAGLSFAFAGVYGRRFKALGVTPMATATGQVTASSLPRAPGLGNLLRGIKQSGMPRFVWTDVPGASSYRLYQSAARDMTGREIVDGAASGELGVLDTLPRLLPVHHYRLHSLVGCLSEGP